jgi:hypothetical protein
LKNLTDPERTTYYEPGTILMVDLGATNMGNEPMYEHPCVVLINDFKMVLVAPCSSKKYGRGHANVIDATPADGFHVNTGIQMGSFRWIDKKRVTNVMGAVTDPTLLHRMEMYILNLFPAYHTAAADHLHEVALLDNELHDRDAKIRRLIHDLEVHKVKAEQADLLSELLLKMAVDGGLPEVIREAAATAGVHLPER